MTIKNKRRKGCSETISSLPLSLKSRNIPFSIIDDLLKICAHAKDVSATEPSTWKQDCKASYHPLLNDKETPRNQEYTPNPMNQALA
jgi:hypothetical protein